LLLEGAGQPVNFRGFPGRVGRVEAVTIVIGELDIIIF